MSGEDGGLMTLSQLRELGRVAAGEKDQRITDLEDRLAEAEARLGRRTRDVGTLATVIRQLAAHVDFPLEDSPREQELPSAPAESEPG